jgi:lipoprotein-anchoring transpeptidase ErfK/SrfK
LGIGALVGGCASKEYSEAASGYSYAGGSRSEVTYYPSSTYRPAAAPTAYAPAPQDSRPANVERPKAVGFSRRFGAGEVVVSFADRRLYYIEASGRAISYPITAPRDQDLWQGVTEVAAKKENPGWFPTEEMKRENPRLPSYVPGGHPMNPLGVRALYLGTSMYRIHGTDAPWTIGTAVSKGCIRMFNEHVLDLYDRVPLGARVTVTWDSFAIS